MIEVQQFGTGTRYGIEILHQCEKKVKTKSQKVLGANSYVCRSYYKEKSGSYFKTLVILNVSSIIPLFLNLILPFSNDS